ncbi:MAG TPA: hypothetical protein VGQ39_08140 [Pyrinomonadaceae bacterium]|jgi:hypothetical protein|nr:hypothetical protein [Pyrinomonadaceae bacterium]
MLMRLNYLVALFTSFVIASLATTSSLAQNSAAEFHNILRENLALDEMDLAALQHGQTVVKLLPVDDKQAVAVAGVVELQVPAQVFLESFRENLATKSNPAILEIGRFSTEPTLADLKDLTFERRDIEDLKTCVVGSCQLKLSARMIERLQNEIHWDGPNYVAEATQLLKLMLLDYVRDYQARGEVALIEYSDKEKPVRLADDQGAQKGVSTYFNGRLTSSSNSTLTTIENAIVWSKIKFGLKPVIAINHITIDKSQSDNGPQILVTTKQIYANHYFTSSLASTAFVNVPGTNPASYLIYENRSRADALRGPFSGIKRGLVRDKALNGLTAILEHSKLSLSARALGQTGSTMPIERSRNWRRWRRAGILLIFLLFSVAAVAVLIALSSNYRWKSETT